MVVSYIRSYGNNQASLSVQKQMIEKYCYEHDMEIGKTFCDYRKVKTRLKCDALELLRIGYRESYRGECSFPQFDQLLLLIATGQVEVICVDVKIRLSVGLHMDKFFEDLCNKYNVKVVEVGTHPPEISPTAVCVAVYHDTDKSKIRPAYCINDFDEMYEVAHCNQWAVTSAFVDVSRNRGSRYGYRILLDNLSKYNVVVCRALFNIDLKTGMLIQYLAKFVNNNVILYAVSLGELKFSQNDGIRQRKLRVCIYDGCSSSQEDIGLPRKIMESFVKYKTNWVCCSYDYEENDNSGNKEKTVLEQMLVTQATWDVMLVQSFSKIDERTAKLERILLELGRDRLIYSMEEGVYLYGKKEESFIL